MTTYRGYEVYKHSFGSQGPALLESLNILENFDLHAMGHNSADYLHVVTEAMKLAYADRDSYYGDQTFVETPAEGLLSKAYAKERAKLIDMKHASRAFVAGNPMAFDSKVKQFPYQVANLPKPCRAAVPPNPERRFRRQGYDPHLHHRQRWQYLRLDAERRVDWRCGDPRQHRHRNERARRAVLAR
jgi:hypothetical protein